ncbi:MAG: M81 family metallopeptidase [Hyphomicrobium sp.]|nr:M81 family metallopeptidase [Hyphomicrobium sp.]
MTDIAPPRVAIIGVWLESNRQAPVAYEQDFKDFYQLEGAAILERSREANPSIMGEAAAFVKTMDATGLWEPVPILLAGCHPHGPIDGALMDKYLAICRKGLAEAGPLDAVYVANHGAMIATDRDDPDGELIALAREIAGPKARVVVTLDLHGNISERMVEQCDLIVGYRTNPHVDYVERGEEAALALRLMLAGLAEPKSAFIRLPLTPASVNLLTASGPYGEMIDYGTRPRAELGWNNRARFRKKLTPLSDAVQLALKSNRPPVIYSDSGDNPGGGGTGRTTELLSALVWAGAENVLIGSFFDPPLAKMAHDAGVGARIRACFNSHAGLPCDAPFEVDAEVVGLHNGTIVGRLGYAQGRTMHLGPSAALRIGGVTAIVISDRMQTADPMFFEMFGLDIGKAATMVVKSRGHFRSGFIPWFPPQNVYEVDTEGLTSPVLERRQWQRIPRPSYPLDEDVSWTPPEW